MRSHNNYENKEKSSFLWKQFLILFLAAVIAGTGWGCGGGKGGGEPSSLLAGTCRWLVENVSEPAPGPVGGEWAVVALSRSGGELSGAGEEYFQKYLSAAEAYVKAAGGVLHTKTGYKYTEYARMILGVTAAGGDVTDIGGYNFLEKLTDMDNVQRQGINGPVWTLIAYDCGGYEIPDGETTREALILAILEKQLPDGGWDLAGDAADPDMTAMALTALAPYYTGAAERIDEVGSQTVDAVKAAADKGIARLSKLQQDDGGYASMGSDSSESCSQVITALSSLGIDCGSDGRFVKDGGSLLEALLSYRDEDSGAFYHSMQDTETGMMPTEQACYALASYLRYQNGQKALYDMTE